MSIALVQNITGGSSSYNYTLAGGGSGSVTVSVSSATGTGNLLILGAFAYFTISSGSRPPAGFNPPTGGAGSTWRNIINGSFTAGSASGQVLPFFTGNAASQSGVFTVTHSTNSGSGAGTVNLECAFFEFSGTGASNSASTGGPLVDVDGILNSQTGGTPHTANITTTMTDLILSFFAGNGSSIPAGTGYSLLYTTGSLPGIAQIEYALNIAPGSQSTAFGGTQANWGCGAVSFMPLVVPFAGTSVNYGYLFG